MKRNKFLAIAMAAAAVTFTSCSKTNDTDPGTEDQGKSASITLTISGQSGGTRAVGAPKQEDENIIVGYTVYVVNAETNMIQAKQSFSSGLTNRITGLTSGNKRIVVIANDDSAGVRTINVGQPYSIFDTPDMLNLQTQTEEELSSRGLVMSGQTLINLDPGENTIGNIPVQRVVAKVRLGAVTSVPEAGHEGAFELTNVHIMKARGKSSIGATEIYTDNTFYGGISGVVSTIGQGFLTEPITLADHSGRYFYVMPNNNQDDNATLMTLEGVYDGQTVYYPIRINDQVGTGESTTDGGFIRRNTSYVLNINIKRPGDGSTNPETPVDPATLDLTITPEDWETELVQNVDF
jgi:hypothetical protein